MSEPNEEPKIIVDEDWKSQVEREKAEAAAKAEAASTEADAAGDNVAGEEKPSEATREKPAPEAADTAPPEPSGSGAEAAGEAGMDVPEASFSTIVTLFFTQAMMMLGQFPDPTGGQPTVDKKIAKHYIDTMEVLQEKTKGNLTADEERMLGEALHAARMAFVSA